jgi:Protein of unknown function (DUF3618)
MGTTPEDLKNNIERTRGELSADVDALADRVSPASIARRRADSVRGTAQSARDRVMGSVSSASESASSAPSAVSEKAQGNPLATGLIAFGVGLLASSLLPSTQAERQIGTAVKDNAVEPVKDFAQDQAQEAQQALRPVAEDHVAQVKQSATEAAQSTADHARSAGSDVADQARSSADAVKG